jgi:hypothetical protein
MKHSVQHWYSILRCVECFRVLGIAGTQYIPLRVFLYTECHPRYIKILIYRAFLYSECVCLPHSVQYCTGCFVLSGDTR